MPAWSSRWSHIFCCTMVGTQKANSLWGVDGYELEQGGDQQGNLSGCSTGDGMQVTRWSKILAGKRATAAREDACWPASAIAACTL